MVEINSLVPDFSLMGSDNNEHKLSQYRGKKVILYFYPRDNTPGCSTEACDFRDNNVSFNDKNAIIIGISTFIINEEGILVKEYRKVKVKEHINTLLDDLNKL